MCVIADILAVTRTAQFYTLSQGANASNRFVARTDALAAIPSRGHLWAHFMLGVLEDLQGSTEFV